MAFERSSPLTRRLLAPNPGPMTLDGTNSYLISAPGSETVVVVDPGPRNEDHLAALAADGRVELVLITHHHRDHSEASVRFAELTGAPVRAADPAFCVPAFGIPALGIPALDIPALDITGEPLVDGEVIEAGGARIRVIATPGHTNDSVCFHLPDDGPNGSVLTGDTILGRGTTIIADPDGTLGDYLRSLAVLRELGPATVLPAHGPVLPDLVTICDAYLAHRRERLDQVRRALAELGSDATASGDRSFEQLVGRVTDLVYSETDAAVRFAAEASVRAQLAWLRAAD
ncbi:MBL fold metallo-hydrolase [Glaciibacter superstes]|uniref:MBL fold metallo-hydrolase n=1 Tax=Glaciibacter superstes TaxID=501023 RepID=UPI0003B5CA13|nr:MBL fold metallo-hydrolase [Glaciibacter superstes]